ncbi:hypothetical protein ACWEXK_12415 [Staphylococcus xylosus]|uniref:hypothetical protein n=1 Tax=Staphylococcus xylosus TaxID=1288 RepID=UPI000D1D9F2A|nr:hypothetical protein [Staphylococcus xylosus]PTI27788.1 hypothetical protein BU115_03320 [Staphylococcus xylosus]
MTNKFRVTNKKDGTVTYHVEGEATFIKSIAPHILKLLKPDEQQHKAMQIPKSFNPTKLDQANTQKVEDKERKYVRELVKPNGEVVHQESDDVTIGDAFRGDLEKFSKELQQPQDTSFYHTGVKDKDGVKHYRCRYKCQYCDNVGNHYIPSLIDNVQCHNCDKDLPVESVESITGEEKDLNANWYVAGSYVPRVN